MGYRLYINSISKRDYNKIKKLSREDLWKFYNKDKEIDKTNEYWEEDLYVGAYEMGGTLYEFGKYVDFYNKDTCKPFFKNKETQAYYDCDHDLHVVTKEFLEAVIENYKERVKSYYNDMMKPFYPNEAQVWKSESDFLNSLESESIIRNHELEYDYKFDFSKITQEEQNSLFKIIEHVKSFRTEWTRLTPYNLHNDSPAITTSWKFEYGLFELVRIYKNFDWKRNVMYYHGY